MLESQLPVAPTGLSPNGGTWSGGDSVTLTWRQVFGAESLAGDGYEVDIDYASGANWVSYYTYDTSSASQTFWPQIDPATYRWRVRAQNEAGWGAWSAFATFDYASSWGWRRIRLTEARTRQLLGVSS